MKKKICFVTAARSEYGLLKWLMTDIGKSDYFKLQMIITGAHLLWEQGHTIDQIIEDGFQADAVIDVQLDTSSQEAIASSMGRMAEMFAPALRRLEPDYLLVLGDRYELLPICNTAFVMRIPIIHLSGGDVTAGAIDDGIRNTVTMLAEYHFPGTKDSAENIVRMRGSDRNIWAVGDRFLLSGRIADKDRTGGGARPGYRAGVGIAHIPCGDSREFGIQSACHKELCPGAEGATRISSGCDLFQCGFWWEIHKRIS